MSRKQCQAFVSLITRAIEEGLQFSENEKISDVIAQAEQVIDTNCDYDRIVIADYVSKTFDSYSVEFGGQSFAVRGELISHHKEDNVFWALDKSSDLGAIPYHFPCEPEIAGPNDYIQIGEHITESGLKIAIVTKMPDFFI